MNQFEADDFRRIDETPDSLFYREARLVTHIDDFAVAAVSEAYRKYLPAQGEYLDLMSSWVSHYPPEVEGRLVGLGMNELELSQNPRLSEYSVRDLNLSPMLPFLDGRFDGVTICVSVQYLTRPVEVFAEIARVLKPGAPLIVTFSNRCFPTKAINLWQQLDDEGHGRLVQEYAALSGGFEPAQVIDLSPTRTMIGVVEELQDQVRRGFIYCDPLFAVVARRKAG